MILKVHKDNKGKATLCNPIIKDFQLSKSGVVPRNAKWIYNGMTLYHLLTPQNTYCDYLKVVAKSFSKHAQQNQEIDIEIVSDSYIECVTQLF